MKNNKTEEADFRAIAEELSLSPNDVKNVVNSFFDVIATEARKLPFDNPKKIYSLAAFQKHAYVAAIPCLGRIGTSYSKYIAWRTNESKGINMTARPKSGSKLFPWEIEEIAESVLSGNKYEGRPKREVNYDRIWYVEEDRKRQAYQVIPKEKNNVQD